MPGKEIVIASKVERWKAVEDFEGVYEVSTCGRVRSLDRVVPSNRWGTETRIRGRVLSAKKTAKGYPLVVLTWAGERKRCVTVHRLVAETFIPNPDSLPLVRHLDEDRSNPSVDNLAWGTMEDNARDMKCWNCGAPYHQRKRWESKK